MNIGSQIGRLDMSSVVKKACHLEYFTSEPRSEQVFFHKEYASVLSWLGVHAEIIYKLWYMYASL